MVWGLCIGIVPFRFDPLVVGGFCGNKVCLLLNYQSVTSGRDLWQRTVTFTHGRIVRCNVAIRVWCVSYVDMMGNVGNMCYPSMTNEDARKMCEDDFGCDILIINVEEVM